MFRPPPMATYSNGHSSENGQCGIFSNVRWTESDRLGPSCKFLGQNSEYPALQTEQLFNMNKNFKKLTLNGLWNGQSVTYSKMQTKVCRGPWGAPMDWCLMKSVNAEYPLSCHKCVKKPPKNGTFGFEALPEPISVLHPPRKLYHHIAQPSAHLKPQASRKSSRSFIEKKLIFWDPLYFGISTRTALESPKSDIFQIWPKRVLEHVISCPEPKFEKRISMGSVPNEQKEILMHDPIRWFKCKLKPPKNSDCLMLRLVTLHSRKSAPFLPWEFFFHFYITYP